MALRTIALEHRVFRQITIYLPGAVIPPTAGINIRQTAGEQIFGQWLELDRTLAQFWESRSIRPKTLYLVPPGREKDLIECMGRLLPEITERGIIDLVDQLS